MFKVLSSTKEINPNLFDKHPSCSCTLDHFYQSISEILDDRLLYELSDDFRTYTESIFEVEDKTWLISNLRFLLNLTANKSFLVKFF